MKLDQEFIKKILLEGNYITEEDIKNSEAYSISHNVPLTDYLLMERLITMDIVGQAVAESYNLSYLDLKSSPVSKEQVNLIPEEVARKYNVVVYLEKDKKVILATDNPLEESLISKMKEIFPDRDLEVGYALGEYIDALFVNYKKSLETRFSKILKKNEHIAPELLEEIFEDALAFRASDIHFEPQVFNVVIRFRIDGVMHEAGHIPKEYYENILNRIKVKSGLRIDEHFSTQDGALRYENKNKVIIDMRTSIAPTVEGEKVVLRLLAAYVQSLTFSDIGLSEDQKNILQKASSKPFGMILVVGPTGSGKTTTLYVLLKLLNSSDSNITTIEDPVEYKIQGINQIQVNADTNLTFSNGLRSIVRQDPDTILVGEIRDNETAEIAINAALTGHLLLSTFHANDAATAIPRLVDMGLEPFLLASTLEVIIAQRLVRKICDNCKHSITLDKNYFNNPLLKKVKSYFNDETTLYEGKGCESCGHTGFHGRTAIFEFIEVTALLKELISKKPSTLDIWKQARKDGSKSLFEDGVMKVKNGVTTLEELLRVAEPPVNI
jgi:type II secretory ATPase GspE/PulE/Tfp pilus assembly ATPase PilB-like protein